MNNPGANNFCALCGKALLRLCVTCGAANSPISNFCGKSGASLDAATPIGAKAEPSEGFTGERRHLTVLFCDLAGSTAIAGRLDPEEWCEIVADYHHGG
jgi:class 3 adenylate cyclase